MKFRLKVNQTHPDLLHRVDAATIAEFELGVVGDERKRLMASRIVIPIHNQAGQLVAYAGRWLGDTFSAEDPKYKLPADFVKSVVLFNSHRVGTTEDIVLVEGYFGAMRLHMLGAPVVALMGTSISDDQIALLRELGVRRVLVLLDGDEPGRQARPALLEALASSFFVTVGELPNGCDPEVVSDEDLHAFAGVFT